jgi:4-amino-4-deoxy-L-arabinose transferase
LQVRAFVVRSPWLWLLLLGCVLGLGFQGSRGLWDPDEGRYTNVALQMAQSGDYLVPRRNEEAIHVSKPPVTYWAIAGSIGLFGHSERAVRLPMALAYLATILMTLRLGRRFVPEHPWLPALFYAASPLPFFAASAVTTDMLLACAETAAVLAYVEHRFGNGSRRWLDAMWAVFGVAFMIKGPPGLLPLIAIAAWEARLRSTALLRPIGLLAFVLVGGSWFAWLVWRHPELLSYLVGHEVVARFASADLDRHGEWYGALVVYVPTLLLGALPWALHAAWRWLRPTQADGSDSIGRAFLLAWILPPLAIFFVARSRLPLYLLPLFVPICLLLAQQFRTWQPTRGWLALAASWLVLLVAAKGLIAHHPSDQDARALARELSAALPSVPQEVVFVGASPRYGLRFYLGAVVEAVSVEAEPALASRPDDDTLAHEFAEAEPGLVYLVPAAKVALFEQTAKASGVQPQPVAVVRGMHVFAMRNRVAGT